MAPGAGPDRRAVHLHQHAGCRQGPDPALQVRRHSLPADRPRAGQQIITGMPMYGNPLPWKTTELTPNIGKMDETDDIRPGMGWQGWPTCRSSSARAAC